MTTLADLRFSVRTLWRRPVYSTTIVAVLALAIGANVALLATFNAVLVRPLEYPDPSHLTYISVAEEVGVVSGSTVPFNWLRAWLERSRTLDSLAPFTSAEVTLMTKDGEPIRQRAVFVTQTLWDVLHSPAIRLGRGLNDQDCDPQAESVVLISERFWREREGADPSVVGRPVRLNGRSHTIIGVAAATPRFPSIIQPDVFLPLRLRSDSTALVGVVGRSRGGASTSEVAAELSQIGSTSDIARSSTATPQTVVVRSLHSYLEGDLRSVITAAMAGLALFLLVAAVNVSGLVNIRTEERAREVRTRIAIGARLPDLLRLIVCECLVLTIVAGAAAMFVAWAGVRGIRTALSQLSFAADLVYVDGMSLGAGVTMMVAAVIIIAGVPMVNLRRMYTTGHLLPAMHGVRVRGWFVAVQVAAATGLVLVLLLLVPSTERLRHEKVSFVPDDVATARMSIVTMRQRDDQRWHLLEDVLSDLRRLPGVEDAGATTALPLEGHAFGFDVHVGGEPYDAGRPSSASVDLCTAGFVEALRIPLLAGRTFASSDSANSPPVALVNRTFARAHGGTAEIVGKEIGLGARADLAKIRVVGVIADVRDGAPSDAVRPTVYRPFSQAYPQLGWFSAAFVLRTTLAPDAIASAMRSTVRSRHGSIPVYDVSTMDARLAATVVPQRQRMLIFGFLSAAVIALASTALYGFVAQAAARRLRELCLRIALGATALQALQVIIRDVWVPIAGGSLIGLLAGMGAARAMGNALYGVRIFEPLSVAGTCAVILGVSALASIHPVQKALRVSPSKGLAEQS